MIALLAVACDGGGPVAPEGLATRIASKAPTLEILHPDLVFAPDGTLWVSFLGVHDDQTSDVFVVSSVDGGRTFSAPILVDDVDQLYIGGGVRQPILAVDDERIAIAVGGGAYAPASSILLFTAPTADPVFTTQVLAEATYLACEGAPADWIGLVDQPEVTFDVDGELWVNWKQGSPCESYRLVLARESTGFAHEVLEDGVRGMPCECCPTDFLQYPDGEMLLALRNNDLNLREIWLGAAPDGESFTEAHQVSTTEWIIPGCPLDGPSLAASDTTLYATWADASQVVSHQWFAVSSDRGRSWTPSFRVEPENDENVTWPQVAVATDGSVWTITQEILHQSNLHRTTDDGASFVRYPADAPTGPVFYPEVVARPDGGVGVIGITDAGELWYLAVDE